MTRYTKESVQRLRESVSIVEVITRYVALKKAGAVYKGLCPFHDERTPSFTVQPAANRYHCFGCGAHGDALSFLMQHERLEFKTALEVLSERCNVPLEIELGGPVEGGVSKVKLKRVLDLARMWYHQFLLNAEEAEGARRYLASRQFSLSFLKSFLLGYAPRDSGPLTKFLLSRECTLEELELSGLLSQKGKREFFSERIMFPILDVVGATIGFSARKWKEETFGGKYINTVETAIFKKSRVLFGLSYSKRRMIKDKIACLVEGQLDALRLIEAGFDFTVATLGTAFGEAHVEQLRSMGVEEVYLAFDQDKAGQASTEKAGHLLMKKGVGVRVVEFAGAKDPDELLQKGGRSSFFQAISSAKEYLPFLVQEAKAMPEWATPLGKDRAVRAIEEKIHEWENAVLVHEARKQLARLAEIPESLLKAAPLAARVTPPPPQLSNAAGDRDLRIELDLIRWLLFVGPDQAELLKWCFQKLSREAFVHELPRKLFCLVLDAFSQGQTFDSMSLADVVDVEDVSSVLPSMSVRRQAAEKAPKALQELIWTISERNNLRARELIRQKMQAPGLSEEGLLELARQYAELARSITEPPPGPPSTT